MEDIEAKDCYLKHLQSCKRYKGLRNKTGPKSSSLTEGPQPVSKGLGKSFVPELFQTRVTEHIKVERLQTDEKEYVSESSDDDGEIGLTELYQKESQKSSPNMETDFHKAIMKDNEDNYKYDSVYSPPVEESDLNKAKQNTEHESRIGTTLSFQTEDPQDESEEYGYEDKYVSELSDDDGELELPEIYPKESPKGSPKFETGRLHINLTVAGGFSGSLRKREVWSSNPSKVLGNPFKPEPYQTQVTENVQVERLQTDTKGSWRQCFRHSKNFENDAKSLLLEGTLPDHSLFQNISKEYGRKSEIVRNISNGICQHIKEQSSNIVHVWPAYRPKRNMDCGEDQIVFAVITNRDANIQSDYQICQRRLNEISPLSKNENKRIHDNEKLYDLRNDDLALYLKSKSRQLMENHKNLTWVTVSVIKSSRHDTGNHRMVKLPCIALYVQIKGLIPIDEDPFEQFLDGYPVDVREGVFSLYGLPTDLHQNVRMGCALDSGFGTKQGTIGPFFKYETDLHTYLLTSAHVLLDPEQMKKLIVDTNVYYGKLGTDTYKPPESISVEHNSRHHLGKLEFAVYREGGQYKPGMEVALVRIDNQRVPIDGKFPTYEFNDDYILSLDDIGSYSDVYKYGSVTGLTKGKVRFSGGTMRTGTLNDYSLGMDLTLHEQIEIESADGVPFGEPGDSGALVFRKDEDKLFAIGIFEGRINDTYMVTPIRAIIEALSEFLSLYRDPPTDTRMDFEEQTSNITLMLYHVPCNNAPLSAGIDRHISAEISRQTNEIQTNILHHTEHRFDSVKAELTAIKMHIDTKIDNSHRKIIESINVLSQAVSNSNNVTSPNT